MSGGITFQCVLLQCNEVTSVSVSGAIHNNDSEGKWNSVVLKLKNPDIMYILNISKHLSWFEAPFRSSRAYQETS